MLLLLFFFFKQKTAYEMRISDWSSDVCSSDFLDLVAHDPDMLGLRSDPGDIVALDDLGELRVLGEEAVAGVNRVGVNDLGGRNDVRDVEKIGRASWRERVSQYV